MNDVQAEQMEKLKSEGYSYFRIARMLGISMEEIKLYCIKNRVGGLQLPDMASVSERLKVGMKCRK
jgi:predicted transcriptional regulator